MPKRNKKSKKTNSKKMGKITKAIASNKNVINIKIDNSAKKRAGRRGAGASKKNVVNPPIPPQGIQSVIRPAPSYINLYQQPNPSPLIDDFKTELLLKKIQEQNGLRLEAPKNQSLLTPATGQARENLMPSTPQQPFLENAEPEMTLTQSERKEPVIEEIDTPRVEPARIEMKRIRASRKPRRAENVTYLRTSDGKLYNEKTRKLITRPRIKNVIITDVDEI